MHPLTITWAPFLYTDIGWKNFTALKDKGYDNILIHPDGNLHRKLSMLAFDLHGDAWDPFGYGQQYLAYHMSVKFNIPLIFFGENGEIEYGGEEKHKNMVEAPMEDWEEIFYKGSGPQKLIDAGAVTAFSKRYHGKLKANKLLLLTDISGIGFITADGIANNFGFDIQEVLPEK